MHKLKVKQACALELAGSRKYQLLKTCIWNNFFQPKIFP